MTLKKRKLGVLLSILIIVMLFHHALHLAVFGTGINGFYESGLSGFSIGRLYIEEESIKNYKTTSPLSTKILIIEWLFLFTIIIVIFVRNKMELKREVSSIKLPQKYKKKEKSTELDVLYNLLKEKKHLRLSTIVKIFKVSKKVALGWARTLESGNLATINYPRFSEPELVINE